MFKDRVRSARVFLRKDAFVFGPSTRGPNPFGGLPAQTGGPFAFGGGPFGITSRGGFNPFDTGVSDVDESSSSPSGVRYHLPPEPLRMVEWASHLQGPEQALFMGRVENAAARQVYTNNQLEQLRAREAQLRAEGKTTAANAVRARMNQIERSVYNMNEWMPGEIQSYRLYNYGIQQRQGNPAAAVDYASDASGIPRHAVARTAAYYDQVKKLMEAGDYTGAEPGFGTPGEVALPIVKSLTDSLGMLEERFTRGAPIPPSYLARVQNLVNRYKSVSGKTDINDILSYFKLPPELASKLQ